jgi:hypothetical protein
MSTSSIALEIIHYLDSDYTINNLPLFVPPMARNGGSLRKFFVRGQLGKAAVRIDRCW